MVGLLRFFSLGDNNKYQEDHLAHFQLWLFDYLFRFVCEKQLYFSEFIPITKTTNK